MLESQNREILVFSMSTRNLSKDWIKNYILWQEKYVRNTHLIFLTCLALFWKIVGTDGTQFFHQIAVCSSRLNHLLKFPFLTWENCLFWYEVLVFVFWQEPLTLKHQLIFFSVGICTIHISHKQVFALFLTHPSTMWAWFTYLLIVSKVSEPTHPVLGLHNIWMVP